MEQLMSQILVAKAADEIISCFSVLQELRPKLMDMGQFVKQVQRQNRQGYVLVYMQEGDEVAACMGYRIFETLPWGKILYIDDLITRAKSRKKGWGNALLTYAIEQARETKCSEVHLDTGHHRYDAHRLYLNRGFTLNCHHLSLVLQ
jgi:GNAT superfamily N-acetyltransferase